MKIVIHPWARKLRNGENNPKNYPYWNELLSLLSVDNEIIQVGQTGEDILLDDYRFDLPIKELSKLIDECDLWISIDSFFQHLAWKQGKIGIVIFSLSDPRIFGHPENINFYDPDYLRPNQFSTWEEAKYNIMAFVKPEIVYNTIKSLAIPNKD